MRRLFAEGAGTFGLVFLGTGACVVNATSGGKLGVIGVGLVFGAAVYALATITGAHMNPAVTIAVWRAGLFPRRDIVPYGLAQAVGAVAASAMLLAIFKDQGGDLGATHPVIGIGATFGLETAMTFILVLTILRAPPRFVPAAAGVIVALEAILAGPLTGASMNPVRSLAPALVSGHLEGLWIYLLAPTLGAWGAALLSSR